MREMIHDGVLQPWISLARSDSIPIPKRIDLCFVFVSQAIVKVQRQPSPILSVFLRTVFTRIRTTIDSRNLTSRSGKVLGHSAPEATRVTPFPIRLRHERIIHRPPTRRP